MKITKAIIPAAGMGTRFLPWTKAVPKEMIPLFNKPAIEYVVQEAVQSAIANLICITSKDKEALANYFDSHEKLSTLLKITHKEFLVAELEELIERVRLCYIRQLEPLGLGHAILMAQPYIEQSEYFGVLLPDDILFAHEPGLAQLMAIAIEKNATVVAVQEVPREKVSSYGIVAVKNQINDRLLEVAHLVEKPSIHDAPSNLAIIGRYVLSPKIFTALNMISTRTHNELQLTDGITAMMQNNEKIFAYKIDAVRHDVGTPAGWFSCILDLAQQDQQYASILHAFMENNKK